MFNLIFYTMKHKFLDRRRLLSRLSAEYDPMYYSPYLFCTVVNRRTYGVRTCDRQMYLDIRHPENVPTARLREIHEYIVNFDVLAR